MPLEGSILTEEREQGGKPEKMEREKNIKIW
jgi:hypothetical protein